jgi:hypothetical protein
MAERRQSSRQKSFLRGCIYFNNRRSAVDCLVRRFGRWRAAYLFGYRERAGRGRSLHRSEGADVARESAVAL